MQCMMTSSNENFLCYWTFVRGIHWSPEDSPHKGQWRVSLMLYLICARTNGWANNRNAGDLRRHRAHYDVTVMTAAVTHKTILWSWGSVKASCPAKCLNANWSSLNISPVTVYRASANQHHWVSMGRLKHDYELLNLRTLKFNPCMKYTFKTWAR